MKISKLTGFSALDSRGRPTVAVQVVLEDGGTFTARTPSGASTGKHEALELRDNDGRGVETAVANINTKIAPALIGRDADPYTIDVLLAELDPNEDHRELGANATLATSLAVAKAAGGENLARYFDKTEELLIPMPMVNILSGGAHAAKTMDIQDVLVLPNGATSFKEAINWISAIRECAAKNGKAIGPAHLIADEGGLGLPFASIGAAIEFVTKSIEEVGLNVSSQVSIALDIASTQLFDGNKYQLKNEGKSFTSDEFVKFIENLVKSTPVISIEDPFAEDDWTAWASFMSIAPKGLQVVGDDLFTTNATRLAHGVAEKSANAILIKANQNGLVTFTESVLKMAQSEGFNTIVSARSGETEDSWLADLATGWRAGQIKVGSTHGSDRTAKWNRLLELEATQTTAFAKPFN
jgi:enolase